MMGLSEPALAKQEKIGFEDISRKNFIIGLGCVLCLAAAAYLSIAFFWGKFSRAEVFFAECSREMLITGNFITPLYHQHAFFDKPIFVYWLIIGMYKFLGVNHFAARLPSVTASLITIAGAALAGSALYGKRAGLMAAGMLGSAFMYLSFSSLCMSDMFLVMFDLLSLICVYIGITVAPKRSLAWWLASVSMGFAFLAKGPVGLVLPMIASIIYLVLTRNLKLIKINHVLIALVTIAIIASPWFYAAYLANGSSALIYFFVHENVQRFAGAAYDAHKPFGYMILGFFLGFAPWSILLPPAFLSFCAELRKINNGDLRSRKIMETFSTLPQVLSGELFLWLWVFVAVGFFCISRGQCDYYTLPAYPAAAILAARYVQRLIDKAVLADAESFRQFILSNPTAKDFYKGKRSIPWIIWLVATAYITVTIVAGVCTTQLILSGAQHSAGDISISGTALVTMPYVLLMITGLTGFFAIKRKYTSVLITSMSGILVLAISFALLLLPQINHLEPVDKITELIKSGPSNVRVGADTTISSWIDEILFQSGKDPQRLDDLNQMRQFVAQDSPTVLIASIDKYKLLSINGTKSWHIIAGYRAVTHSLTPGYIISRKGRIADRVPLIVATNCNDIVGAPVSAPNRNELQNQK